LSCSSRSGNCGGRPRPPRRRPGGRRALAHPAFTEPQRQRLQASSGGPGPWAAADQARPAPKNSATTRTKPRKARFPGAWLLKVVIAERERAREAGRRLRTRAAFASHSGGWRGTGRSNSLRRPSLDAPTALVRQLRAGAPDRGRLETQQAAGSPCALSGAGRPPGPDQQRPGPAGCGRRLQVVVPTLGGGAALEPPCLELMGWRPPHLYPTARLALRTV